MYTEWDYQASLCHSNLYSDELYHHGILGQKWGVRRYQNPDGTLTEAGRARYGKTGGGEKAGFDPIFILPAAIYATEMAMVLAPPAIDSAVRHHRIKKYEKERNNAETDPKTGLKIKKDVNMDFKEDMKRVNPWHGTLGENKQGSDRNCVLSTLTYDLRRKGYDVTAGLTEEGYNMQFIKQIYPKAKLLNVSSRDEFERASKKTLINNLNKVVSSQGEGARGLIKVSWLTGGAHAMAYECRNGKIVILDAQSNVKYMKDDDISALFDRVSRDSVTIARLDNLKFNKKEIKKVVA